jgi:hypothetical protein
MQYIAGWPAFHITAEIAEKLETISPATIARYLKKDKESLRLKGKSLTKAAPELKSRIPIRTFYTADERRFAEPQMPGFWQIDTADFSPTPLRTDHSGPICAYPDCHRRRFRLD